ncbi:hypothetical protein FGO68_gene9393 [Halteria grandinella]|uniref:Uncharacterized protein n=1 Tax=Halteria grandinella TaxID=5974 RepID=A0A8J8T6C8_HALGN|nr:hypothetical protein FGO68_gene9393 [Halteria grandinella]
MFDRVRVCTLCFRIYKELESYYFKELRRNFSGSQIDGDSFSDGNETERLMNREVKNDKEDADPRLRVDKALNRIFGQVKKNMEKQHEARSISVGAKQSANKDMFKTIDPKSSQKLVGAGDRKGGDYASTKLPPIAKKPTQAATTQMNDSKGLSRNPSNKGQLFGAKSIDILQAL